MKKRTVLCVLLVAMCIMSSVAVCYAYYPSSDSFINASGGGSVSISNTGGSGDTTASHPWYDMNEVAVSIYGEYIVDNAYYYSIGDSSSSVTATGVGASFSINKGYMLYVEGDHSYTAGPDSECIYTYVD